MPSAVAIGSHDVSNEQDDLDRYFNYDAAVEDFLKDLPIEKDQDNRNNTTSEPTKDIDEEVKVKKQRKPIPKLDDNRLLSQEGIPRLRKITKSRLKLRGKGHEFGDISRLLNKYQLWLDDLYPRAKFRDALDMVEKVGHSKRMQVMRKAWLDATKPYQRDASPAEEPEVAMAGALPDSDAEGGTENVSRENENTDAGVSGDATSNNAPDDDELDALLAENAATITTQSARPEETTRGPFEEDDDIEEDELDALLAEDSLAQMTSVDRRSMNMEEDRPVLDDFADEEEVMASMNM